MKWRYFQKSLPLLAVLFMGAGCGGGGSAGPGTVQIVTDADAIAYQVAEEAWRTDVTPKSSKATEKTYEFNADGRYGVALYCSSSRHLMLFQLNTNESRTVQMNCDTSNAQSLTMSGNITDTTDTPEAYGVAVGWLYDIVYGSSGTYTIKNVPPGKYDLAAVTLKTINNKTVPQKFYIERNIDFLANDNAHNITLTAANTVGVTGHTLSAAAGATAEAYLITANNTYFTAARDGSWYLPEGVLPEDIFVFFGFDNTSKVLMLEAYRATEVPKTDKNIDLSYIRPLNGVTYDNSGTFGGLGYQPSAQSRPLRAYVAMLYKDATDANCDLVLSSGWMQGKNSYTIPDLSGLNGFAAAWYGDQADSAEIDAIMADRSVEEMLESKKIFMRYGADLFLMPNIRYEIASETIF